MAVMGKNMDNLVLIAEELSLDYNSNIDFTGWKNRDTRWLTSICSNQTAETILEIFWN